MNLRNMEIFIMVAKKGNVTEAAKELHMSQPAVSMQIRRLEEQYGIPLTSAHSKGIKLTDAGEVFLTYAERMLLLEGQLSRSLQEFRNGNRGHILIGAPAELITYFLPKITFPFIKKHSGIDVEFKVVEDRDIENKVKSGEIDIGFTFDESMDHFGARVTHFKMDDWLLIEPILSKPINKLYVLQNFNLAEVSEDIVGNFQIVQVEHTEMIKQAVMAGLGAGIVLKSTVVNEAEQNLLLCKQLIKETCISMVTRPAEKLQKSLWMFIDYIYSNPLF